MVAAVESLKQTARFPEEEVRSALIQFWREEALERADDPFATVPGTKGTIYELLPAFDSLTIVRSLLLIEKVLDCLIPVSLVKPGGYASQEEMLKDLVPKLKKYYEHRDVSS